jgi:hypothetical protein
VRVYLPSTLAALAAALRTGSVESPLAYAVTPALREWYTEGDEEELEYAATTAAARASLRRLADGVPRRVVLAADVPEAAVRPAPDVDRAAVRLRDPVQLSQVASALVDDPAAEPDVRSALGSLAAADAGDEDAGFTVDAVEDHELGWYAAQELSVLVEIEG